MIIDKPTLLDAVSQNFGIAISELKVMKPGDCKNDLCCDSHLNYYKFATNEEAKITKLIYLESSYINGILSTPYVGNRICIEDITIDYISRINARIQVKLAVNKEVQNMKQLNLLYFSQERMDRAKLNYTTLPVIKYKIDLNIIYSIVNKSISNPNFICHNDIHWANILEKGLIDFAYTGFGNNYTLISKHFWVDILKLSTRFDIPIKEIFVKKLTEAVKVLDVDVNELILVTIWTGLTTRIITSVLEIQYITLLFELLIIQNVKSS